VIVTRSFDIGSELGLLRSYPPSRSQLMQFAGAVTGYAPARMQPPRCREPSRYVSVATPGTCEVTAPELELIHEDGDALCRHERDSLTLGSLWTGGVPQLVPREGRLLAALLDPPAQDRKALKFQSSLSGSGGRPSR
jgi:hypothetical protein